MLTGMTTEQAAARLGVPPTTLKIWLGMLPIPTATDDEGRRRLDPQALSLLQTVKALRQDDCGYATIRRHILPAEPAKREVVAEEPAPEAAPEPVVDEAPIAAAPEAATGDLASTILTQLNAVLTSQNELAEKYARACQLIGQHEATIMHLQAQLAEARRKLASEQAPSAYPW